jgi:hypothetical protein
MRSRTAQPAVGIVPLAQALQGTCTAYPLQGRIQPQCHQDGRVNRRASRPALHRPDPLVQGQEIHPCHKGPDGAHRMVLGDERFQVTRPQLDLGTVRPLVALRSARPAPCTPLQAESVLALRQTVGCPLRSAPLRGQINGETLHQCSPAWGIFSQALSSRDHSGCIRRQSVIRLTCLKL